MVARQGDVATTAERELCAAEQSGGVLGLMAARCWMGEAQGGRGGLNEGAGVLGVRATGRAGEISGEMGGVRWRAGEGRGRRAMTGGPGAQRDGAGNVCGRRGLRLTGGPWRSDGASAGRLGENGSASVIGWLKRRCWAGGAAGPAQKVGPRGGRWVWAGKLGLGLLSISLFPNLIQTKFEFKYEFEFNPQSNKSMHQHECNTKI